MLPAVIAAYAFRLIGKGSFYPTLFSYLRSFIYIGLYAAWGLSVRQRIVQKQVGRYLAGTSAQITDWGSNIRYAALNTAPISKETMRGAEQGSVTVDGGLTVHTMPIGGGYAVWTEDVSALLAVKE